MKDYKQKRQELIQSLMQKHPSLKEDGLGQKLEQVYGINLGQDLMSKETVSMWAIARYFNTGMNQERIFYVLQNMAHYRQLSDEENRKSILKSIGNDDIDYITSLSSHWRALDCKTMMENRTCSVKEFARILKYAYNNQYIEASYYSEDARYNVRALRRYIKKYVEENLRPNSSNSEKIPTKELTPRQWERYKKKYLNPDREFSFDERKEKSGVWNRVTSYFSSK